MLTSRLNIRILFLVFALSIPLSAAQAGGGIDLVNDETFIYDIRQNSGELGDGSWNDDTLSDACDGCWELRIDDNAYSPPGTFVLDPTGREVTFPAQSMSGLDVVRRVYVPQAVNFIRHLNILSNTTGADITVQVGYDTNLGSDSDTTIEATSSGDLEVTADDTWLVTNGDSGDPIVSHVWDGAGGLDSIDAVNVTAPGNDDVDVFWNDVTVPAGETVIYMTLGAMSSNIANAIDKAEDLFAQSDFEEIIFNLDPETISAVQNWRLQDTDEDGMPDFFEEMFGLDINDPSDAALDGDDDGLTNLEEYLNGADPTDADTDDDGVNDGAEVMAGTDPDNADSDGDGVFDPGEINSARDPLTADPNFASLVQILSTDENAWDPQAVSDSAGNTHLAWVQDSLGAADDRSYNGNEIYYSLLDSSGLVLIGPTRITNDAEIDVRPRMVTDSMNRAVILWQNDFVGTIVRVDPANDDQDGDAADPLTLLGVPETAVLNDATGHYGIAIDDNDDLHMSGHNPCGPPLTYAKFDIDGTELIAEITLDDTVNTCHANPDLAIDSSGNVHIVYTPAPDRPIRGGSGYEVHYIMIDGATGETLIDSTVVSVEDGFRAKHATVDIDSAGLLHVIYGSAVPSANGAVRGGTCTDGEVYRLVLDPSLDDQDGSPADAATILVVDETLLSGDDGRHSWYTWSHIVDDEIEITWNDGDRCRNGYYDESGTRFDILRGMAIDLDGNVVAEQTTITEIATGGTGNRYTQIANGKPYWSQFENGVDTIVTNREGPTTLVTSTATGTASLTTNSGTIFAAEAVAVADLPATAQADAPRNIDFVDGLFRVTINTDLPGDTVELTINLPTAVDASTVYYKWNNVDGWSEFAYAAGATANDIVLTLTDGGAGDADGIVNGQIVDPGGPGTNLNMAPSFDSTPVTTAAEIEAYTYAVMASDPNTGDTLTITGTTLPGWLTLADNGDGTATLSGTPGATDVGNNDVVLTVTDDAAIQGSDTQSFTIVVAANEPPTVGTGTPPATGTDGATYTYNISATDPEGGTITITAPTLPGWLALTDNGDGTAVLTGTPGANNAGSNPVVINITDSDGKVLVQSFNITVALATVITTVAGKGGGSGAASLWMLLLAAGLLYSRNRRQFKGAQK